MKWTIANLEDKDIEMLYQIFGNKYNKEFKNMRIQITKAYNAKKLYEETISKSKNT